jgi:hypothetical protein
VFLLPELWLGVSTSRPNPTTTADTSQVITLTSQNGNRNAHNVFRDKFAEIDARPRRLEEKSKILSSYRLDRDLERKTVIINQSRSLR